MLMNIILYTHAWKLSRFINIITSALLTLIGPKTNHSSLHFIKIIILL